MNAIELTSKYEKIAMIGLSSYQDITILETAPQGCDGDESLVSFYVPLGFYQNLTLTVHKYKIQVRGQ
jgi:hypothetical protein